MCTIGEHSMRMYVAIVPSQLCIEVALWDVAMKKIPNTCVLCIGNLLRIMCYIVVETHLYDLSCGNNTLLLWTLRDWLWATIWIYFVRCFNLVSSSNSCCIFFFFFANMTRTNIYLILCFHNIQIFGFIFSTFWILFSQTLKVKIVKSLTLLLWWYVLHSEEMCWIIN